MPDHQGGGGSLAGGRGDLLGAALPGVAGGEDPPQAGFQIMLGANEAPTVQIDGALKELGVGQQSNENEHPRRVQLFQVTLGILHYHGGEAALEPYRGAQPIFAFLRRHGGVDRREMFKTFNMGVGFVLIVRPTFAVSVIRQLNQLGEEAFVIGEITKGGGGVKLVH